MKAKILVLFFSILIVGIGNSQSCDCKEYIYLNEPNDGGKVHKYLCNPDGSLTEINPSGPWYNNNTTGDQLNEPHGIAFDLNGYLYIAETSSGDVRRLDCEGNIFPESTFVISGEGGWNFASIGNEVFINRSTQADVAAYNVCSGTYTNGFEFCDAENNDWGFYYDKRTGYFYSAYKGTGANTGNKASILRYTIADFGSGNCIPVWIGPGDGTLTVGVSETVPNTFVRGLTTDANGNLYVVERLPDQQTARLLKYDSNGLFVAATAYDATDGDGGWFTAAGVAYSETCNCLHVSTASQNDDCISTFDLNLNYLGPGVPGNAGGFTEAKAIGILKECCPTLQANFNRRVCATVGAKYFLNVEAFDDCDGVVCGSSWVPQGALTGMTFDPCDNSITITGEGCGTFALSLGASPDKGCIAQTSMFTICAGTPEATVTPVQGTCTGTAPNNNASINITGATFVTRYGFSTGATYTGPNFVGAMPIVGGTATIPNLVHDTQYTVRVFLRGNCFTDYTVMTPEIICNTCVTPTATAASTNPTCAGDVAQSNGSITISGFAAGQRYQYSTGATFNSGSAIPASITAIPLSGVIVSNLANTSQQYTVRIYDATDNACFVDRTVSITSVICGACACTEYVYVNEPGGNIHKLEVNPTTAQLTEVGGINGIPWVNNPTVFPSPHGLGVDRNGFLFIGTNFGDPNSIRKLDCSGNLFPETGTTGFRAPSTGNWGYLLTNIQSYDGFVYANGVSNRIYKIDPCTGNSLGHIVLGTDFSDDWGLYIDKNGKFYATQPTGKIFVFTPVASDFTSNTVFPFLIDLGGNPTYGGLSPQYSGTGLQGIVTDDVGNIYVVEGNRDFGGTPSRILKFTSTGTFLAAGPVDNLNNGAGWCQMTGIIFSETSGKLYTTSLDPGEDCVYIWNTNLTPLGAAIGPVPNLSGQCKAIGILSECCPLVTQTINEVICSGGNGEKFSLQEVIDCGDGIICEGQWQEISNNSNGAIVFDECDLTIIVNGSGCAEYRLSKTTPAGPGQQCGIFSITVIICTEVPNATVAGASGTCTGSTPNNDAVINITAATNATQAGISTGATYTGPAFNGVGTVAITGGTASFTGRMHNTQYTVRLFNGSNNCYEDTTLTTPSIICNVCSASVNTPTTQCNNNGTPANSTDDWFSVTLTGSITNGSGNYVVKIGAYTSPVTASGTAISITGNGQAGNPLFQANGTSTYTVRIEDATDSSCFTTVTVGPVQACSNCPDPNCFNVTKQIIR